MSNAKLLNQNLIYTNQLNNPGYPPTLNSEGKLNNNILPDNIVYTENGKISQDILPSSFGKQIGDICIFLKDPGNDYLTSGEQYNSLDYPEFAQIFGASTGQAKNEYRDSSDLEYTYRYKQIGNYDFVIVRYRNSDLYYYSLLYYKKIDSNNLSFEVYKPNISSSLKLVDITYDGTKYILLFKSTYGFVIESSTDLISWTRNSFLNDSGFEYYSSFNSILYEDGQYYIVCTLGDSNDINTYSPIGLLYSSNLENWASRKVSEQSVIPNGDYDFISHNLIYKIDGYYFILFKNILFYSTNLTNWNSFSNWPTWNSSFTSNENNTVLTSVKKLDNKYLILGSLNKRLVFFWMDAESTNNIGTKASWNLVQISTEDLVSYSAYFTNSFIGIKDIVKYNEKYYAISGPDPESSTSYPTRLTYVSKNLTSGWEKDKGKVSGGTGLQVSNNNLIIYNDRYYYVYTDGQYYAPTFGTTTGEAIMYIKAR